jgi:DNA-binding response OmpR family regulator
MRLLLVEDNLRVHQSLKASLSEAGYAVDSAYDGDEGQWYAESGPYDAIILDVMLPRQDGFTLCSALRRQRINVPILMLTARDSVEDRVQGLDSGADDYLVKPFTLTELFARLRALMRRTAPLKTGTLHVGDLSIDPATHAIERAGLPIELTAKEYAVLEYFMRHPNQVITREMVIDHVWNYDFEGTSNVVDVYIRRLRRQIDDPFEHKLFETVYGYGYRLIEPDDAPT